jgi:Reverse transcriptase (RNA-dependent DNA polymerase)
MVLFVYVDDIVLTGSHPHLLSHLVSTLQHSFALKDLGPLTYFLGIKVTSYPGVLHLSQGKYIRDCLPLKGRRKKCKIKAKIKP